MFKKKNQWISGLIVLISVLIIYGVVQAGSLTPSASPAATMNSLADIAGSGFATATHSLKAIYDKIDSLVADSWNKLTSELTTAGSIGKLLVDNIDATISSRAPASTALSNATWTDARAGYLDKLNITNGLLEDDVWTDARGVKLDNLDATVNSRSSHSAADVWTSGTRTLTQEVTPRGPVVAMSAEAAATYTHANAAKYCYDLSAVAEVAMDGDTSTTYTDWRLPTVGEAAVFEGTISDSSYVWTATIYEAAAVSWILLDLYDGCWLYDVFTGSNGYVRCVR